METCEVREAGHETEKFHRVRRAPMDADHVVFRQTRARRHIVEVGSVVDDLDVMMAMGQRCGVPVPVQLPKRFPVDTGDEQVAAPQSDGGVAELVANLGGEGDGALHALIGRERIRLQEPRTRTKRRQLHRCSNNPWALSTDDTSRATSSA
jgi:hypothetical protein